MIDFTDLYSPPWSENPIIRACLTRYVTGVLEPGSIPTMTREEILLLMVENLAIDNGRLLEEALTLVRNGAGPQIIVSVDHFDPEMLRDFAARQNPRRIRP